MAHGAQRPVKTQQFSGSWEEQDIGYGGGREEQEAGEVGSRLLWPRCAIVRSGFYRRRFRFLVCMKSGGDKMRLVFKNFHMAGGKLFGGKTRLDGGRETI